MTGTQPIATVLFVTCVATGVLLAAASQTGPAASGMKTIVVAELFTSEGCSSCPPADDLLRRLVATQPVKGVEIIALGSHVDYWDRLGWRDPFSSPLFSTRQSEYAAAAFRTDRIYTPQLVVDGTLEALGSDATAVRQAIMKAAQRQKAMVSVRAIAKPGGRVQVEVEVAVPAHAQPHETADIMVAVTEDDLVSRVNRGENTGRTLAHSAVVRSLTTVGRLPAKAHAASMAAAVSIDPSWQTDSLRVVAFVQERASRRVLGTQTRDLDIR